MLAHIGLGPLTPQVQIGLTTPSHDRLIVYGGCLFQKSMRSGWEGRSPLDPCQCVGLLDSCQGLGSEMGVTHAHRKRHALSGGRHTVGGKPHHIPDGLGLLNTN